MGTLLHRCVEVRKAIELSFGMMSRVGPGIHVLNGSPRALRGRVCFWHGLWHFSASRHALVSIGLMTLRNAFDLCEKLTVFPYARYTVEFCIKFPFLWYSQVQDQSGGWREIHVQKCIKTNATRPLQGSDNAAAVPAAMLAAAQSIPAGCHETKSLVWKFPLGELRDEKGRCYFICRGVTRSSQITLRTTCCYYYYYDYQS